MDGLKLAIIAACVWGSAAFAMTAESSAQSRQELQTISSWMAHLNHYYDVDVDSSANLRDDLTRAAVMQELYLLENTLHDGQSLNQGDLILLSCDNPVCGDGGKGKCLKCSIDN
jgi:hypothetical protein